MPKELRSRKVKKAKKKDDDLEFEFAETRTAATTDQKDGAEPEEVLGMSKIGVTAETDMSEQEAEPEEGSEEAEPEPEEEKAGLVVVPPLTRTPVQDEEGLEGPLPPLDDLEIGEDDVELEEVTIGGGSRKVKVMRVKPTVLTPEDDEEWDDIEGPTDPSVSGGGMTDLGTQRKEKKRKRTGGGVSTDAGLGMEVDLDAETVKRLSAPLLPQEFMAPPRLFHRQFRRGILFLIFPAALFFLMYVYVGLNPFTILFLVLILVLVLITFFFYGISPFYSGHLVTKTNLRLKQGAYFTASLPLDEVRTVKVAEPKVGRLGIYSRRGGKLYISTDRTGFVEIDLRSPRKIGSHKNISRIFLTIEEPSAFVRTMRSAIKYMRADRGAEDAEGTKEDW